MSERFKPGIFGGLALGVVAFAGTSGFIGGAEAASSYAQASFFCQKDGQVETVDPGQQGEWIQEGFECSPVTPKIAFDCVDPITGDKIIVYGGQEQSIYRNYDCKPLQAEK